MAALSIPMASMNSTRASAKSAVSAVATPSGSESPKPGVSGAMQVKCSFQRSMVEIMSREESGDWCRQITTGPLPTRR